MVMNVELCYLCSGHVCVFRTTLTVKPEYHILSLSRYVITSSLSLNTLSVADGTWLRRASDMHSVETAAFISIIPTCNALILSACSGRWDEVIRNLGMHPITSIEGAIPPIPMVSFVALMASFSISDRCR
jgi:hypothetical protein